MISQSRCEADVSEEDLIRFLARVGADESGCWPWLGTILPHTGYGQFYWSGRKNPASRFAHLVWNGPIPPGWEVDHLCRTRACVNPEHLEAVDHRTNILRGETFAARQAAQTHCVNGHDFTEKNTYRWKTKRYCLQCQRDRKHSYWMEGRTAVQRRQREDANTSSGGCE